jgi:beta-lactamase class A
MLILGVGISAIAGTVITLFDPIAFATHLSEKLNLPKFIPDFKVSSKSATSKPKSPELAQVKPSLSATTVDKFALNKQLNNLEQKITTLVAKYPKLAPGVFFIDLDNGSYINIKGEQVFAAASTIKIPILVAFFQDVDAGKIRLDEPMTVTEDVITSGSGDMQYQGLGKKYTALEVATKMIIISDNTATDMLIKKLGGKEVLNQRFKEWGLTQTVINNRLPDLAGTNTTSPRDLAYVLARVSQGELISLRSRDRMLGIMEKTKTRTLLPAGLEEDAIIAHKTGDIGKMLGDAGIIDMPSGKRYIGAVLANRPHNDPQGRVLIQEISRTVYQHFKWYDRPPALKAEATAKPTKPL